MICNIDITCPDNISLIQAVYEKFKPHIIERDCVDAINTIATRKNVQAQDIVNLINIFSDKINSQALIAICESNMHISHAIVSNLSKPAHQSLINGALATLIATKPLTNNNILLAICIVNIVPSSQVGPKLCKELFNIIHAQILKGGCTDLCYFAKLNAANKLAMIEYLFTIENKDNPTYRKLALDILKLMIPDISQNSNDIIDQLMLIFKFIQPEYNAEFSMDLIVKEAKDLLGRYKQQFGNDKLAHLAFFLAEDRQESSSRTTYTAAAGTQYPHRRIGQNIFHSIADNNVL